MEEYRDDLGKLLEQCTVRISHRGKLGTGFYVAPGLILTCAHVLGEPSAKGQKILFRWNGADYEGTLEAVWPTPCPEDEIFPDVALISHPVRETSCVLLEAGYGDGDRFYSWGYSSAAPAGESLSGRCEGSRHYAESRERRLIKFKETQVLPGVSGSPLLNRETGAVCGIVKRTRNQDSDMGGLAVRAQLIIELVPDVVTRNRAFHRKNRAWSEALDGRPAAKRLEQERRNRGPKFVDRGTQEAEFKHFYLDAFSSRPQAAQVYLLPSLEDDCPELFTERLREDTVEDFARSFNAASRAAIDRVTISQEPRYQNLEVLQRDLNYELFAEFDALALYDRSNLSAKPLAKHERLRLPTFVFIEQTINADSAKTFLPKLLPWYVNTFWAAFCADAHVMVFLHLISSTPNSYGSWLDPIFRRLTSSRDSRYMKLDAQLTRFLPNGEDNLAPDALGAPVKRLSPLAPIVPSDIKQWLQQLEWSRGDIDPTVKRLFGPLSGFWGSDVRLSQIHGRLDDLYHQHAMMTTLSRRQP